MSLLEYMNENPLGTFIVVMCLIAGFITIVKWVINPKLAVQQEKPMIDISFGPGDLDEKVKEQENVIRNAGGKIENDVIELPNHPSWSVMKAALLLVHEWGYDIDNISILQ